MTKRKQNSFALAYAKENGLEHDVSAQVRKNTSANMQ